MGLTDEGLRYEVLSGPEPPPTVLAVEHPRPARRWTDEGAATMVGQQFGFSHQGRMFLMQVVAARVNPTTHRLELTCR